MLDVDGVPAERSIQASKRAAGSRCITLSTISVSKQRVQAAFHHLAMTLILEREAHYEARPDWRNRVGL
jgi:hypothetical protein